MAINVTSPDDFSKLSVPSPDDYSKLSVTSPDQFSGGAAPTVQKSPDSWLGGVTDSIGKWYKDVNTQIAKDRATVLDSKAPVTDRLSALLHPAIAQLKAPINAAAQIPGGIIGGIEGAVKGVNASLHGEDGGKIGLEAMQKRMQKFTPFDSTNDPLLQMYGSPMAATGAALEGTGAGYGEMAKLATGDQQFGTDISNAVQLAMAGGMALEGVAKPVANIAEARRTSADATLKTQQDVALQQAAAKAAQDQAAQAQIADQARYEAQGPKLFDQPTDANIGPENPPVPVENTLTNLTQEAPLPDIPVVSPEIAPYDPMEYRTSIYSSANRAPFARRDAIPAEPLSPNQPWFGEDNPNNALPTIGSKGNWRNTPQVLVDTPPENSQFKFSEPSPIQKQVEDYAENNAVQFPSDLNYYKSSLPELFPEAQAANAQIMNAASPSVEPANKVATVTPLEDSKGFQQAFGYARDNVSDVYTDVQKDISKSSDIPKMVGRRNVLTQGAAMRRVMQDNPAYVWGSKMIETGGRKAKLAAEMAERNISTKFNSLKWFDGINTARDGIMQYIRGEEGSSPRVKAYMDSISAEMDKLYDRVNDAYKQKQIDDGIAVPKDLPNMDNGKYFGRSWKGKYESLVTLTDKDGKHVSMPVRISGDNIRTFNQAYKYITQHPEEYGFDSKSHSVTMTEPAPRTRGFTGEKTGTQSLLEQYKTDLAITAGDQAILDKLGMKDVQNAWKDAYNYQGHTQARMGVRGWAGDEPWLNPKEQATRAIDSLTSQLQGGHLFTEAQKASRQLSALKQDFLAQGKVNLPEVLQEYYDSHYGVVTNETLDSLGRYISEKVDLNKYVGNPAINSRSVTNFARDMKKWLTAKVLSNTSTAIVQGIQGVQNAAEVNTRLAAARMAYTKLGVQGKLMLIKPLVMAIGDAAANTARMGKEGWNHKMGIDNPRMAGDTLGQRMWQYMKDNGIADTYAADLNVSHSGSYGSEAVNSLANVITRTPDLVGRSYFFTAVSRAFIESGVPEARAFEYAKHMSEVMMNSSLKANQPRWLKKAGVLGEGAGNLRTFMFNELTKLYGDAKFMNQPGAKAAFMVKIGMMLGLGGIMAIPGLNYMAGIYDTLKDMWGKNSKDPAILNAPNSKMIMGQLPPSISKGLFSDTTGLDFSGSFQTGSPGGDFSSYVWPLYSAVGSVARNLTGAVPGVINQFREGKDDRLRTTNQAARLAPNLPYIKGALEENIGHTNAKGNFEFQQMNDAGTNVKTVERTPREQLLRKLTGVTPLREAQERDLSYGLSQQEKARTDARNSILSELNTEIPAMVVNNRLGTSYDGKSKLQDLYQKYMELGGDSAEIQKRIQSVGQNAFQSNSAFQNLNRNLKQTRALIRAKEQVEAFNKLNAANAE